MAAQTQVVIYGMPRFDPYCKARFWADKSIEVAGFNPYIMGPALEQEQA
jgi:hypothetical protein